MGNHLTELEKRNRDLERQIAQLTATLEQMQEIIGRQQKELEQLREEKQILFKRLYGPKADRPSDQAQLLLDKLFEMGGESQEDDEGEKAKEPEQEQESEGDKGQHTPKRKKKRRANAKRLKLIDTGLEERVEVIEPDPAKVTNPITGERYPVITYEETRRLAEVPACIYVRIIRRPVYQVPSQEPERTTLVTAALPQDNPIDRCKADVSLLAGVLRKKYELHLPLYRLQDVYHQATNMWIGRSTFCGWIEGCALALQPIVKLMRECIMKHDIIALDDTTVPCLAPGTGSTEVDRLWAYSGLLPEAPYVVYDFTQSREAKHPLAFVPETYRGYILGDACSSHDELMRRPGVIECGCWDHARRYFTEASTYDPLPCSHALAYIQRIYLLERKAKDKPPDERKVMRQEVSAPILAEFKVWADTTAHDPFLKDALRRALGYVTNQWVALNRHLEDGRIPIANSHTERAMRPVGIGRKNWLFVGSEAGGKNLAIILSLVTTCRLLGIDVLKYFTDVLARVNTHPNSRLNELLPDKWRDLQQKAGRTVVRTERPRWEREDKLTLAS